MIPKIDAHMKDPGKVFAGICRPFPSHPSGALSSLRFLGTLGARHKAPEGILQDWTHYGHTCKGRNSETAN
jgi:hypothetical protein